MAYGNRGSSPIKLDAIEINGTSLKSGFHYCNIYEDILSETWSGDLTVSESIGLQETLPIIGEEIIFLRFSSVDAMHTAHESINFIGRITKVENFIEAKTTQRQYKLHFVSLWVDIDAAKRVRMHYRGTATEIASSLLNIHFGRTFETLDPSKTTNEFVFPNLSPYQCINMLKTMCISKKYNDPCYLFWEDRKGHHFTSLSQLMDQPEKERIKMRLDSHQTTDDPWRVTQFLLDPMFDTLENQILGMYGQSLITYDKVNKKFEETTQTYSGSYGKYKHVGSSKLTKARVESPKNMFQFIMNNEPPSPGVYNNVKEWAKENIIRSTQVRGIRAHIRTSGRTSLKPGDIIYWEVHSLTDETYTEEDKVLSGKWMITRIRHFIRESQYESHMEIIKDGIK